MALKKLETPKRWRSKEAKEIVAAVQRAGGQVERTASGHLSGHLRSSGQPVPPSSPQPQQWPRRWARCPQHLGHRPDQDDRQLRNRSGSCHSLAGQPPTTLHLERRADEADPGLGAADVDDRGRGRASSRSSAVGP
jgi:hypothetical protein